jgi:GNAT superfamily N-acetyltransferase
MAQEATMRVQHAVVRRNSQGFRFSISLAGKEIGHAYLYIIHNDIHLRPYGLLEDVAIEKGFRGSGYGTALINQVIERVKKLRCYKLIATSRDSRTDVHRLYKKIGFKQYGQSFRIDFQP